MSNTFKHKNKGKFYKNLLDEVSIQLRNMFNRHNFQQGQYRKIKKDLEDKIAEKEFKKYLDNLKNT